MRRGGSAVPAGAREPLPLLLVSMVTLAVAAVASVARSALIAVPLGCYADGAVYCAMAEGQLGVAPHSRRVLAPFVVRLMDVGSLANRFRVLDAVCLLLAAVACFVLTRRVAAGAGAAPSAASAAGVAAAALLVASPFGLRALVFVPVFTDTPALAFGLLALVAITSEPQSPTSRVAAAVAAGATVLTREAWLLPLVAAAALAAPPGWRQRARAAAPVAIVGGICFVAVLFAPRTPADFDQLQLSLDLLERYFLHAGGFAALTWSLLFAVGLLPALVVARPRRAIARTELALLAAAGVHLAQTVVGGGEAPRIASPAMACLLVVGVAWVAARPDRLLPGLVLLVGTAIVWRPWVALYTASDYEHYFTPHGLHGVLRHRVLVDGSIAAVALAVAVIVHRRVSGAASSS